MFQIGGRFQFRWPLGLLFWASCLLLPASSFSQVAITGTVTDPSGIPYSNASISFQLVPSGTNPCITPAGGSTCQAIASLELATLSAAGSFSVNLYCNSTCSPSIQPSGTQWQITVNEVGTPPPVGTGPQSFSTTVTITGAASLSATLSALAPRLSNSGSSGYLDADTFGVRHNGRSSNDASVTSGQPTVVSNTIGFVNAPTPLGDVGRFLFTVRNVAAGNVDLKGTILSVQSATQATVSANASSTQSGETIYVGDDDTAAWELADAAALNGNKVLRSSCGQSLISDTPFSALDFSNFVAATNTTVPTNQTIRVTGPDSLCSMVVISPNFNFASPRNANGSIVWFGNCSSCTLNYNLNSSPGWNVGSGIGMSNIFITGYGQTFAGLNGKNVLSGPTDGDIQNVTLQRLNASGGTANFVNASGENSITDVNCQNNTLFICINTGTGNAGIVHVRFGVFAFVEGAISASGNTEMDSPYMTQIAPSTANGAIQATGGANLRIKGGTCDQLGTNNSHVSLYVDGTSTVDSSCNFTSYALFQTLSGGILRLHNSIIQKNNGSSAWLQNAGTLYNDGGLRFINPGGQNSGNTNTGTYVVSRDGLYGSCSGTATSNSTLGLYGIWNVSLQTCTSTTLGGPPSNGGKTLMHLICSATAVSVNGACTVLRNGSSAGITCSLTGVLACSDFTHTQALSPGDIYTISITTGNTETGANYKGQVDVN